MPADCTKKAYTRRQAMDAAAAINRKTFSRLSHYQCTKCGRWHLTSKRRTHKRGRLKH